MGKNHRRVREEQAWPRILLYVPVERTIPQLAFFNFLAIAQQGHPFIRMTYGRTDLVRNKAAQQFVESQFTHLLMLDVDHLHPPDIVQRLGRWVVDDRSRQVVGGLNFRRGEPYDPCCFLLAEDGNFYPPAEWGPGLIKVDAIGTGSILIAKEVFLRLPKPWFFNDYSRVEQGVWPGEDMGFSGLCRMHGIDMWVDTTTTSPHLIDAAVDESSFRGYLAAHDHEVVGVEEIGQPGEVAAASHQAVNIPTIQTRLEA